jgi:pectate lyase
VASYHQTSRYHRLPLTQMQNAEQFIAAGGEAAEVGKTFIQWAEEDLRIYSQRCFDPKEGLFLAMTTDGVCLRWQESRIDGYYGPQSFTPRPPDGILLWGYAMAYRLTQDAGHWNMARTICKAFGLGDIGEPNGPRDLNLETVHDDWNAIYTLLELHRATEDDAFLRVASRIGDLLVKTQAKSGLFPRAGREYARTGDEIPLALLHLAAALAGKSASMPSPAVDDAYFHCEYDGPLENRQKNPKDARTNDDRVYYGARS